MKIFQKFRNDSAQYEREGIQLVSESACSHLEFIASTQLFMDACVRGDLTLINASLDQANVLLPFSEFGELLPLNLLELKAIQFCVSEEKIDAYETTLAKVTQKTQHACKSMFNQVMLNMAEHSQNLGDSFFSHQYLTFAKICNSLILSTQKEVSVSANQIKKKLMESLHANGHPLSGSDSVHFLYGCSVSKLKLALSSAEKPSYLKERMSIE